MTTSATRERNRRGEGTKLRAEILAAAAELLEVSGGEEAVTLRAVARAVGISAPSIYAHFPDRQAIVDAVVDDAFRGFNAAIAHASAGESDPIAGLRAGCAAYLGFAEQQPSHYRILFGRRGLDDDGLPVPAIRIEGFHLLVGSLRRCVEAKMSTSTDLLSDATAIWVALHGYATLHASLPGFPWPDPDALLDHIVYGLGRVRVPKKRS